MLVWLSICLCRYLTFLHLLVFNGRMRRVWAGFLALWAACAAAQPSSYPTQPIRWFLPGPPGSPPDLVARVIGERLAASLGKPVVIENRPGAGGTIALAAVSKAAADGHTIGLMGINHAVAPALIRSMPYDTDKDLAPVTQLVFTANILVVRADSPHKSAADLVAFAKANPSRLTYASAGNATPSHLAAELFRMRTAIDARHVPFKGPPAAVAAVLGEQVDLAFVGAATAGALVKTGKLRALATSAPVRMATFPELPTLTEIGFPGVEIRDWMGVVVPAGTAASVIDRLGVEIARALAATSVQQRLASVGMEPAPRLGPQAFRELIRSELSRWQGVVRAADVRAD